MKTSCEIAQKYIFCPDTKSNIFFLYISRHPSLLKIIGRYSQHEDDMQSLYKNHLGVQVKFYLYDILFLGYMVCGTYIVHIITLIEYARKVLTNLFEKI
jgi:hypothetical protein